MTRTSGRNSAWRWGAPLSFVALVALTVVVPRAADELAKENEADAPATAAAAAQTGESAESAAELQLLFRGDDGPHRPGARFKQSEPVLAERGIHVTYS